MTCAPDEAFIVLGMFAVFGGCVRFSIDGGEACDGDHSSTCKLQFLL